MLNEEKKMVRPSFRGRNDVLFDVPCVGENVAVVVLQSIGSWSDHLGHHIGSFPWWREFMFLLS